MNFREWCAAKYGIQEVVEGKITNLKFVPGTNPPPGIQLKPLTPKDGSIYEYMKKKLKLTGNPDIQGFVCPAWMNLDSSIYPKTYEYKEPAPIYFKINNEQKFREFTLKHQLAPGKKYEPLSDSWAFLAEPTYLEQLYTEYKAELKSERDKNPMTLEQLEAWEKKVIELIEIVKKNPQLENYVEKAHVLSKDYSNDDDINTAIFEACSGYSLSLQIYAELNRELLSREEYTALQHAIDILGRGVEQGLKTDANFMHYLVRNLGKRDLEIPNFAAPYINSPAPKEKREWVTQNGVTYINPIKNRSMYPHIEERMNENINNLLYGKERVEWWGSAQGKPPYKMRRFLPDANMMSETNEITLQGGRMINHSAMLRIIKIGITATGDISNDPKQIHHFDYYHVQTNLGAECNNYFSRPGGALCTGTYITKLEPTKLENDQIIQLKINPSTDPMGYQQGMETTIRELIKTERHFSFIRKPQTGPNGEGASPVGSPEALEWTRLNDRLALLKGKPIGNDKALNYFSIGLDGTPIKSVIRNQKNYAQDSGSCAIFSIKQLVASILEMHATSLHSNYLQHNNGKQQVAALNKLHEEIKKQKLAIQSQPKPKPQPQPVVIPKPVNDLEPKPVVLPKQLSYDEYYAEQMQFFDRFIRKVDDPVDKTRLQRIAQLQKQQQIAFLDDFLDVEPGKELETTRIGYPPLDHGNYTFDQLTLAPDAGTINEENRRLSRYRLVYGPVDFYLGNQLEKPTEIPVITACAPNMMGTSQVDLDEFSEAGILKATHYEKECRRLADFIVAQAKTNGNQRLIMPTFGVGVYIDQLNPHSGSKETAKKIMYQAFADAAQKHLMNIDWIVWNDPSNPDGSAASAQQYQNYSLGNVYMNAVLHTDMLLYAQERQQKGEKVVLLNPGSDRTIGGAYTHKNPKTLEEQIAQKSDLILLHSEFNQSMTKAFNAEFKKRKAGYTHKLPEKWNQIPPPKTQEELKQKEIFKEVSKHIYMKLGIQEQPLIMQKNNHFCITFHNKTNAEQFSTLLANKSMSDASGSSKFVQKSKGRFVVYLTKEEWNKLPELWSKKETQQLKWELLKQQDKIQNKKLAEGSGYSGVWVYDVQDKQGTPHKEFSFKKGSIQATEFAQKVSFTERYQTDDGYDKFILTTQQAKQLVQPKQPQWTRVAQDGVQNKKLAEGSGYAGVWVYDVQDKQGTPHKEFSFKKGSIQADEFAQKVSFTERYQTDDGYDKFILTTQQAKQLVQLKQPQWTRVAQDGVQNKKLAEGSGYAGVWVYDVQDKQGTPHKEFSFKKGSIQADEFAQKVSFTERYQTDDGYDKFILTTQQAKQLVQLKQPQWTRVAQDGVQNKKLAEGSGYAGVWVYDVQDKQGTPHKEFSFKKGSLHADEFAQKVSFTERYQTDDGYDKFILTTQQAKQLVQPKQPQWTRVAQDGVQNKKLAEGSGYAGVWVYDVQDKQGTPHKEFSFKKGSIQADEFAQKVSFTERYQTDDGYDKFILTTQQAHQLVQPKETNQNLKKSLIKIDKALRDLRLKIGGIDQHKFSDARDRAVILLDKLNDARDRYEKDIESGVVHIKHARKTFKNTCEKAITDAKPVLERDLGWGDYLANLMKTLANAVIWTVTLGNVNSFFTKVKPASLEAVEKMEQELDLGKKHKS